MGRYLIRVNAVLVLVGAIVALQARRWLISIAVALIAGVMFFIGELVGKRERQ